MNKYAILIGNSQFPNETDKSKLPDLACPVQDVDGLAKVLASERGEFKVLALKNKPSYEVLDQLQEMVNLAAPDDLLLIYYSGHGKQNQTGVLHLTTLDTVVNKLESRAISINRVYEILDTAKSKKIVIILDCCYSGAAKQGFKGVVTDQLQQLNNARGTYLVTASTELQVAHESEIEGYSLFTKHLIAGLETGDADKDSDGWVSMNELYDYVHSHVMAENPRQQPTRHVKEERGSFFIVKSGRNEKKEPSFNLDSLLLPLIPFAIVLLFFSPISEEKTRLPAIASTSSIISIPTPSIADTLVIDKNGIAKDTKAGLMWLRFAYGQTWQNSTAIAEVKGVNDWAKAHKIVTKFNEQGGISGYKDWRLPTTAELKKMIRKEQEVKEENKISVNFDISNFWFWSSAERTIVDGNNPKNINYSANNDCGVYKKCYITVWLVRSAK